MRRKRLVPAVRIIIAAGSLVALAAVLWIGAGTQSSTPVSAATLNVDVGNFWFCDSSFQSDDGETEIAVGDTVTWDFNSASVTHTTTECTGSCGSAIGDPGARLWDSGNVSSGSFQKTFNSPGTFQYQCNIHPSSMRGTITVNGNVPTLPPPPSPVLTETKTPTPTLLTPATPMPTETETPVPTNTAVPAPTSTPQGLVGDVNGDGAINAIDAALILQFGAGLLPALPNIDRADVNDDGTVNAVDAALILQFTAGLLPTLEPTSSTARLRCSSL